MRRTGAIALALIGVVVFSVSGVAWASARSTVKRLVVLRSDAPDGYTSAPGQPSEDLLPQIAECVGKPVTKRKFAAETTGDVFTNPTDGSQIQSTAGILKSKAMAKKDIKIFKNAAFYDCVKEALIGQGLNVTYVVPNTLFADQVNDYGDYASASDVQAQTAQGFVHILEVGIVKGKAELDVQLVTTGGQSNVGDFVAALDTLDRRLEKAKV